MLGGDLAVLKRQDGGTARTGLLPLGRNAQNSARGVLSLPDPFDDTTVGVAGISDGRDGVLRIGWIAGSSEEFRNRGLTLFLVSDNDVLKLGVVRVGFHQLLDVVEV